MHVGLTVRVLEAWKGVWKDTLQAVNAHCLEGEGNARGRMKLESTVNLLCCLRMWGTCSPFEAFLKG